MNQALEVRTEECPFLRPAGYDGHAGPAVAIYCALPGRRVRVPARDERRTYCDPGRFVACPVYNRRVTAR